MAADILLYDTTHVPVEMIKSSISSYVEILRRNLIMILDLNFLKVPEPLIQKTFLEL